MYDEIGVSEDVLGVLDEVGADVFDDEIGFSFKSLAKGIAKGVKSVGKVAKGVVQNKAFQAGVGVLAVAFPAVGIPAAAAVATANVAISQVEAGKKSAKALNSSLSSLKVKASTGDRKAAVAVNAMQVALAARKAKALGLKRLRPVAVPGKGSFTTTPTPLGSPATQAVARSLPTSLYSPTPKPAAVAAKLAGGGGAVGKRVLGAVQQGKPVELVDGVAVVTGQAPIVGRRVWVGKAPAGVRVRELRGAHAVTRKGAVLSGQSVFVAA